MISSRTNKAKHQKTKSCTKHYEDKLEKELMDKNSKQNFIVELILCIF